MDNVVVGVNIISNLPKELDLSAAAGPQVYLAIRDMITRGDLLAGARISEAEIASQFHTSRQPVREAFIRLANDRLVEIRPQRGTFVQKIDVGIVKEAQFVREAIETSIVSRLVHDSDQSLIALLRDEVAAQSALDRSDIEAFMKLDERFHKILAEQAGQLYAWQILQDIKLQMDRVRHLSLQRFARDRLVAQHTVIIDALEQKDEAKVVGAMQTHLREILNDLPKIAQEQPDFFELEHHQNQTRPT